MERRSLIKITKFAIGILIAFLIGFLFAGFYGALGMGLLLSMTFSNINIKFNWKATLIRTAIFSTTAYLLMLFFGLLNAGKNVHEKVRAIRVELERQGYTPKWVIISQKRNDYYNSILYNSVKNGKSKHLTGRAIDLYVFDVNGDWNYDIKDFELIQKASQKFNQSNPDSKGRVFNYLRKGKISRRMVHVEIF